MKKVMIVLIAFSMGLVTIAQASVVKMKEMKKHPMVSQVNQRINNQEKMITSEVNSGKLKEEQAKQYRRDLSSIKQEENTLLKTDKGKLTKKDQKELNQKLDITKKDIKG